MTYLGIGSNIVWNVGLGNVVQVLELTDYRVVWALVLILNASMLAVVVFLFPAMPPLDRSKDDLTPARKLVSEVLSYFSLVYDWRARRYLAHKVVENFTNSFEQGLVGGFYLAWHGWSQPALVMFMFWPEILKMFTMSYYEKLEKRFGNYNSYRWTANYLFM